MFTRTIVSIVFPIPHSNSHRPNLSKYSIQNLPPCFRKFFPIFPLLHFLLVLIKVLNFKSSHFEKAFIPHLQMQHKRPIPPQNPIFPKHRNSYQNAVYTPPPTSDNHTVYAYYFPPYTSPPPTSDLLPHPQLNY